MFWSIGGIVLIALGVMAAFVIPDMIRDMRRFTQTSISQNLELPPISDTTFIVNGVAFKMIGIRGGSVQCKGYTKEVELENFYLAETEVTQELWLAVMGSNPSIHNDSLALPVENINLVDCANFIYRLDSILGEKFYIPSLPMWLYAACLGGNPMDGAACTDAILDRMAWYRGNSGDSTHLVKEKVPDKIGLYDMIGNVAEWTISGSDPLYHVVGGHYDSGNQECIADKSEFFHGGIKGGYLGLRLAYIPEPQVK